VEAIEPLDPDMCGPESETQGVCRELCNRMDPMGPATSITTTVCYKNQPLTCVCPSVIRRRLRGDFHPRFVQAYTACAARCALIVHRFINCERQPDPSTPEFRPPRVYTPPPDYYPFERHDS